ncbi:MAG: DUF3592 domain-containing protein [Clostridia bacterium]|nr:DUF3592 domain-containing protein [Clostridia bacterium]
MSEESKLRFKYNKILLFVAIVLMVISLGLIAGGIVYTTHIVNKTKDYVKTDSTVVDIAEVRMRDSEHGGMKTLYAEIVEYVVDGVTYSAQNTTSSNRPKSIGSKIEISYNPNNPEEYVFPQNTVGASAILFVLGVVFGIAGIVLLRYYIRT